MLRRRIISGLHLGTLRSGSRLPSIRAMARVLDADPRLILAAYRDVERDGLVELRPRSGIYVAPAAKMAGEMLPRTARWALDVLAEGISLGLPAPAIADFIRSCLESRKIHAACIECNEDQIAALSHELRTDYGLDTSDVDVSEIATGGRAQEALERADLLVTTRFHAREVRPVAAHLGRPWLAISGRTDVFAEIVRALRSGPVYFVGVDPRFADKLGRIFASVRDSRDLRVLICGRDDLERIPEEAPVYVSHPARDRVRDTRLLARVLPAGRAVDQESSREILAFIVRLNMAAMSGP